LVSATYCRAFCPDRRTSRAGPDCRRTRLERMPFLPRRARTRGRESSSRALSALRNSHGLQRPTARHHEPDRATIHDIERDAAANRRRDHERVRSLIHDARDEGLRDWANNCAARLTMRSAARGRRRVCVIGDSRIAERRQCTPYILPARSESPRVRFGDRGRCTRERECSSIPRSAQCGGRAPATAPRSPPV